MKRRIIILLLVNSHALLVMSQSIQELEQRLKSSNHDSLRFKYTFLISDARFGLNPRLAQKIGIEALRYLESSNSPVLQVRALQNVANRYWEDGEYQKSIALQKKSLHIAERNRLFFWAGKAYHLIGLDHYYMSNYDSTLYYYSQAKEMFKQARDSAYLSKVENHIGLVYDQIGEYGLAIDHIIRSIQMQENIPGFNIISFSFQAAGGPNDSTFFNFKIEENNKNLAYEISRKDTFNIAQSLRSIGRDYLNINAYRKAVPYFLRSAAYYEAADFEPFWEDLAEAHLGLQRFDSATYFSDRFLSNMLDHGMRNNIAMAYSLKGKILLAREKFGEAITAYRKALDLHELMGNRLRIAEVKIALVRTLIKKSQYKEAQILAEGALTLAKAINSIPRQSEAYELLSRIYDHLQQREKALLSLSQFHSLDKKLAEGQAGLQMAKLDFLFSLKRKEQQLNDLQQENLIKEERIETQNLQIALAAILLLIIAVTGGLYYSRFRYNKKLNERLKLSNKQQEGLLHEIHHRVKNNLQIISSLISLKMRQSESSESNETLQQLNGRIYSMGLIHEKLYLNENIQSIRLDEYLAEVSRHVISSFEKSEHDISLQLKCQPVEIDVDRALTCGLIANELVTNSIKYAFTPDQLNPEIAISLAPIDEYISIQLSDNGRSEKPVSGIFKKSFGSRFVDQLVCTKLNGEWGVKMENGVQVTIKFKLNGTGKG